MKAVISVFTACIKVLFAIIKLFPVQNKITIASRQSDRESQDIQMLKEELQRQAPDVKVVTLCRTFGGSIFHMLGYAPHFLRQLWHIGTSKAVVIDSYCMGVSVPKQRKNTIVLQMWHALGALKKFGLSIAGEKSEGRSSEVADAMNMHHNYTNVLISSEACRDAYKEAFGYDDESMLVGSLPRVDAITDIEYQKNTSLRIYNQFPELKNKKIIVYAPTFRKDKDISAEVLELNKAAAEKGFTLIVKKHPLMEIGESQNGEAVIFEAEGFSTLETMSIADYVICDYSAVVFEAALMGKPLFFYAFDFDEYEGSRSFYIDYKAEMPGFITGNPYKLIDVIENNQYDLDIVKQFADKYISVQNNCTEKLASWLIERI